ncbi:MAG: OmpA family protein [Lysobacteraceae bacterium]
MTQTAMSQTVPDGQRHTRWTLGIALLLLLALLFLWLTGRGPGSGAACCGADTAAAPESTDTTDTGTAPTPAVEAPAPPVAAAASVIAAGAFAAHAADGKLTLTGVVADEAERSHIVDAATAAYGAGNVVDHLRIDGNTAARGWDAKLADIFGWQKTVPDAAIDFDGRRWLLTGTVTSEAVKTARGEQAQAFFGADAVIDNRIQVVQIAKAGDDVQCGDRIAVAVNFASGSSALNAEAKAMLDRVFDCLKDGRFEISGHTDNTGSATVNQRLSLARADAAKAYLVSKGLSATELGTAGHGSEKPVADNATPEGRAQNRRIEFAKQ